MGWQAETPYNFPRRRCRIGDPGAGISDAELQLQGQRVSKRRSEAKLVNSDQQCSKTVAHEIRKSRTKNDPFRVIRGPKNARSIRQSALLHRECAWLCRKAIALPRVNYRLRSNPTVPRSQVR
jgi:hypothetical protein